MLTSPLGTFTFDSSNRLTSADTVTYTYDAEGTRIKSRCGDTLVTYTYNVNARLSQLLVKTENGNVTKYVYGLGLIGEETDGSFKTYHFDCRGSTIALTDSEGNVTDTFEYDTYGKLTARTGNTQTPFLYNGRDGVITEANGLYYMRARYYSPVLKRFINADKVHGDISNAVTLNRYVYTNCNPVSNIDPLGLSSENGRGANSDNSTSTVSMVPGFSRNVDVELELKYNWEYDGATLDSSTDIEIKYPIFGDKSNISFALYDSDRHSRKGLFSETILSGEIELPSFDAAKNKLTVFSGEVDFMTGCWHIGDNVDIALLDVGHAELKASVGDGGFELGAFASLWSPSITFRIYSLEISLSAEIVAIGKSVTYNKKSGFKVSSAGLFGGSIGVKWG